MALCAGLDQTRSGKPGRSWTRQGRTDPICCVCCNYLCVFGSKCLKFLQFFLPRTLFRLTNGDFCVISFDSRSYTVVRTLIGQKILPLGVRSGHISGHFRAFFSKFSEVFLFILVLVFSKILRLMLTRVIIQH